MDFSQTIGLSMTGNEEFATDQQIAVLDASVVHKTDGLAESIDGVKTFLTLPETALVPTTTTQLVNKAYADTKADDALVVHLAGTETITGTKTFTQNTRIGNNGNSLLLVGSDHCYVALYPDTFSAGRKGYVGYPNATSNDITITNDIGGVTLNASTTGSNLMSSATGNNTIQTASGGTGNNVISVNNTTGYNRIQNASGVKFQTTNTANTMTNENNTITSSTGDTVVNTVLGSTKIRANGVDKISCNATTTALTNITTNITSVLDNTLTSSGGSNNMVSTTASNNLTADFTNTITGKTRNVIKSTAGYNNFDAFTYQDFTMKGTGFSKFYIDNVDNILLNGTNTMRSTTGDNVISTESATGFTLIKAGVTPTTRISVGDTVNTISNATNTIDGTTDTNINMTSLTPLNVGSQISNTSFINTSNTLATSTGAYHRVSNGPLTSGQPYFEAFKGSSGIAGFGSRFKHTIIQYFSLSALGVETSNNPFTWSSTLNTLTNGTNTINGTTQNNIQVNSVDKIVTTSTATTITNTDVGIVGNVYCNKNYNVGTIATSIPLCTYMAFGTKLMGITTGTNQNMTMNGANWNGAFVNNFTRVGVNVVPYAYEFMMDSGTYTGTLSLMSMTVEVINGSSGSAVSGTATFNVSTTSGVGQATNGVLTSPLTIVASALMGIRFRFTLTTGTLTANTAGITIRILCYQV